MHSDLSTCTHVFVCHDANRKQLLQAPYDGPYKVLKWAEKYFTVDVKGNKETISLDQLKPAHLEHSSEQCQLGYYHMHKRVPTTNLYQMLERDSLILDDVSIGQSVSISRSLAHWRGSDAVAHDPYVNVTWHLFCHLVLAWTELSFMVNDCSCHLCFSYIFWCSVFSFYIFEFHNYYQNYSSYTLGSTKAATKKRR